MPQVSAGYEHTCALTASGSLACWGANYSGESSVPSSLTNANAATQVSAGGYHACAVTAVGSIICWGENTYGQTSVPNLSVDTTPPTMKASLSGTAGSNGWYTSSVTMTLTPTDNPGGSGVANAYYAVDNATCPPPASGSTISSACQTGTSVSVSGDGSHTVSFFSADKAGNFEAQQTLAVKIDTTPPAASPKVSQGMVGLNGWYQSDATVAWNWTDAAGGSDIDSANCTTSSTSSGAGALQLSATCKDLAGNQGSASFTVKVDKTAPAIACASADTAWHATDVSLACTASHATPDSGLATATDASFSLTTSVPTGTETANAATNSHQVCDVAGDCATAGPITGIKVDKNALTITITTPTNASYLLNQAVTASYTCTDGGSGVPTGGCTGPMASGSALDTGSVGTRSFTVKATDNVGNTASQTVTYTVNYTVSGFLAPVAKAPAVNTGHAGKTYPVKFQAHRRHGRRHQQPLGRQIDYLPGDRVRQLRQRPDDRGDGGGDGQHEPALRQHH